MIVKMRRITALTDNFILWQVNKYFIPFIFVKLV